MTQDTKCTPGRARVIHGVAWRWISLASLLTAGCVTVQDPDQPKPLMHTRITDAAHPAQPTHHPATMPAVESSSLKAATDPCAVRLHDMIGPILEYYALHRQLPARVEDIRAMADVDVEINLNCPVSNAPYVYVTQKLVDPQGRRLILHDAEAVHAGKRWAIVDESKAGQARVMTVVLLSEAQFKAFAPVLPGE